MTPKKSPTPKARKSPIDKLLNIRAKLAALPRLEEADTRKCAVKIYDATLRLRADVDDWQVFCMQSDWDGERQKPQPKEESRNDALRFAVKFAVGLGPNSNGNWVRKLQDLLRTAWDKKLKSTEVKAHIKQIQKDKRAKATETRAKRRASAPRSVTLLPSKSSQELLGQAGKHAVKAVMTVFVSPTGKLAFEIIHLKKKAPKSPVVVKSEKPKPAKKPTSAGK